MGPPKEEEVGGGREQTRVINKIMFSLEGGSWKGVLT